VESRFFTNQTANKDGNQSEWSDLMSIKATKRGCDWMLINSETKETLLCEREENGKKYRFKAGEEWHEGLTLKECKEVFGLQATPVQRDNDSTWSCCHPCAIIVELLAICEGRLDGVDGKALRRTIDSTLDSYGFLGEDGLPDADTSRNILDRWMPQRDQKLG